MRLRSNLRNALVAAAVSVGIALVLPAGPASADRLLPGPVTDWQQVLTLDPRGDLTLGTIKNTTDQALGTDAGAVRSTLAVHTEASSLTTTQISGLLAGRRVEGATLVDSVLDPAPETTVDETVYRMRIPGQGIIVIRGEIYVDGLLTPVLIIIILVR